MLKILQARLQQYMNHELSDVQVGFRKGRGTEIKLSASAGSLKKQESSRKTSTYSLHGTILFPPGASSLLGQAEDRHPLKPYPCSPQFLLPSPASFTLL